MAAGVGCPPVAEGPLASVRREHLLPREKHPRLLRRDDRAFADCGPAGVAGRPSAACLQPAVALGLRLVWRGDVPAGAFAHPTRGRSARRRIRVRVPAVPIHALRASRVADGAVDATRLVGLASNGAGWTTTRRSPDRSLSRAPDTVVLLLRHLLRHLLDPGRDRGAGWSTAWALPAGRAGADRRRRACRRPRGALHPSVFCRAAIGG